MNPLTDDLTPEAKAELAAIFAEMKRFYDGRPGRAGATMAFPQNGFRPFQYQRCGW